MAKARWLSKHSNQIEEINRCEMININIYQYNKVLTSYTGQTKRKTNLEILSKLTMIMCKHQKYQCRIQAAHVFLQIK